VSVLDTIPQPRQVRVLTLIVALGALLAMPRLTDAQIRYEVISSTTSGSARQPFTPTLRIIHSEEELQALWSSLGRNVAPPRVEFRSHLVFAYFLGIRATTGFRLEAERVEIRAGTMTVKLVEVTPGDCCVTGQLATMPDIMISTIPWKGPVSIEVRQAAHSCCP
jgi:hypothetical protein